MTQKRFCDICGDEVHDGFVVYVYDRDHEKDTLDKDLCEPCMVRVTQAINGVTK